MTIAPHVEVMTVAVGTATTWGASAVAFTVAVTPMLQAAALVISIIVGLLTGIWTWQKIVRKD